VPEPVVIDSTTQSFGGYRYRRNPRGYYRRGTPTGARYLHREVWAAANGEIAPNHHIHHIDGDRANNQIGNLESVERGEHQTRHMTEERRAWARNNMIATAVPAARAWHASPEGLAWHRAHGLRVAADLATREPYHLTCAVCGADFDAQQPWAKSCSAKCRASANRARRRAGVAPDPRRQTRNGTAATVVVR